MVLAILSLVRLYVFIAHTGTSATAIHAEPGIYYFLTAWNWRLRFKILARAPTILTGCFRSFVQSLHSNAGIVPRLRPCVLPSTFVPLKLH